MVVVSHDYISLVIKTSRFSEKSPGVRVKKPDVRGLGL
jgi:hypothetical protein